MDVSLLHQCFSRSLSTKISGNIYTHQFCRVCWNASGHCPSSTCTREQAHEKDFIPRKEQIRHPSRPYDKILAGRARVAVQY